MNQFMKLIKQARTITLSLAPVSYAFGYCVWSVYASKTNLGLLPILSSQYFISGIFPTILIAGSVWGCITTQQWLRTQSTETIRKITTIVTIVMATSLFLPILLLVIISSFGFVLKNPGTWAFAYLLAGVASGISMLFIYSEEDISQSAMNSKILQSRPRWIILAISIIDNIFRLSSKAMLYAMISITNIVALSIYFQIYQQVPQAYGGVKPRPAIVYFDESKITHTLSQILRISNGCGNAIILYKSDNLIIFRIPNDSLAKAYEVKQNSVAAIAWLE